MSKQKRLGLKKNQKTTTTEDNILDIILTKSSVAECSQSLQWQDQDLLRGALGIFIFFSISLLPIILILKTGKQNNFTGS